MLQIWLAKHLFRAVHLHTSQLEVFQQYQSNTLAHFCPQDGRLEKPHRAAGNRKLQLLISELCQVPRSECILWILVDSYSNWPEPVQAKLLRFLRKQISSPRASKHYQNQVDQIFKQFQDANLSRHIFILVTNVIVQLNAKNVLERIFQMWQISKMQ